MTTIEKGAFVAFEIYINGDKKTTSEYAGWNDLLPREGEYFHICLVHNIEKGENNE